MGLFDSVGKAVQSIGGAAANPIGTISNQIVPGSGYLLDPMRQVTGDIIEGGVGNIGGNMPGANNGRAGVMPVQRATPAEKQAQYEELRRQREIDLTRGFERGKDLFGSDRLGRLGEGKYQGGLDDLIKSRQRQAVEGLQANEYQAQREQMLQGLNQGTLEQQRALRAIQGRSGIRGGLAAAQMGQIQGNAAQQRANLERDLLVQNIGQKQQAQNALEQSMRAEQGQQAEREKFNLGQRQRELMGMLTSSLGEAQLGGAERGSISQEEIGRAMQQTVANQLGSGGAMGKK